MPRTVWIYFISIYHKCFVYFCHRCDLRHMHVLSFLMVLRMKLNDFVNLLADLPVEDYDYGKCFKIRYGIWLERQVKVNKVSLEPVCTSKEQCILAPALVPNQTCNAPSLLVVVQCMMAPQGVKVQPTSAHLLGPIALAETLPGAPENTTLRLTGTHKSFHIKQMIHAYLCLYSCWWY